jgi:hypothetical protein
MLPRNRDPSEHGSNRIVRDRDRAVRCDWAAMARAGITGINSVALSRRERTAVIAPWRRDTKSMTIVIIRDEWVRSGLPPARTHMR